MEKQVILYLNEEEGRELETAVLAHAERRERICEKLDARAIFDTSDARAMFDTNDRAFLERRKSNACSVLAAVQKAMKKGTEQLLLVEIAPEELIAVLAALAAVRKVKEDEYRDSLPNGDSSPVTIAARKELDKVAKVLNKFTRVYDSKFKSTGE